MEQKERKREICASVTNRLKLHVGHDEKYAIPFAHRGTTGNFNFNNLCPKSSSTRKNIDYFCVLNLKNKIKRCPPQVKRMKNLQFCLGTSPGLGREEAPPFHPSPTLFKPQN